MKSFLAALLFAVFTCSGAAAQTKIAARVNDDIISERDLNQRLEFIRLTGQADTTRPDIRDRVLKQLIDEKLKRQEAAAAGVSVSAAELEQAVRMTLRQNRLNYDDVAAVLKKNGLPLSVVGDQIESDLLFIRAVKKNAARQTEVSDREVEAKLNEIKEMNNQRQYLVSQALLPVESEDDDAAVYGRAMRLIMRVRDGEKFEDAVPDAVTGWVGENSLSDSVKEELSVMRAGQLSSPVKTPEGYRLFVLHAVRAPSNDEKREAVRLMQLFLPRDYTANRRKAVMRDLSMTKGSCEAFKNVSEQLNTAPRVDLGTPALDDLPAPIRSAVENAPLLEAGRPVAIEGGDLIFMVCARETVSALPDKEEIKARLEAERLETVAQRRLRELRRFAVMEVRR